MVRRKRYEINEETRATHWENDPEISDNEEAEMLKRKESEERTRKRTRGPYRKSRHLIP
jgi:hypothetical protein